MKALATLTCLAALALAAPAQAGVVAEMKVGSSLDDLIVGPDGGAWVFLDRRGASAVGRAEPDGRFRTTATSEYSVDGTLGPDGTAWYEIGPAQFLRADAADTLSTGGDLDFDHPLGSVFATGPDGMLWSPAEERNGMWHMAPDGRRLFVPVKFPKPCDTAVAFTDMITASDGVVWLSDRECGQLVRIGAAGTNTIDVDLGPEDLAADHSGGVWVSGSLEHSVLHVDAAGRVARFDLPSDRDFTDDVAVAPDDSAWFVLPDCRLLRVTPAGEMTTSPTPIHASQLGFDPSGGVWLAGEGALAHLAPGEPSGACDDRPPSIRVRPHGASTSLRRLRTVAITVREPAQIDATAYYFDGRSRYGTPGPTITRLVRTPHGATVRYRVSRRELRRLARRLASGHKASVTMSVVAGDAEGNLNIDTFTMRVTR